MRPTLNLDIPAQSKRESTSFNTQPEAVRRWLAALPLGHVGESTRQIYAALYQVNRLDIDVRQRLEFLEQVAPVLDGLLQTLRKHFTGKTFPLGEKTLRIALLSTELMTAMVVGYQAVMMQCDAHHWFRQRKWEQLWTTALHRMMHYFSAILCNYRLLHLPEPPGVWLRLHRGYHLSADNGLLDIAIPVIGNAHRDTSVDYEYKQLLLSAMLAPQRLRADQHDEIHGNMALWISGLELVVPATTADCGDRYCIDFDEDAPPASLRKLHAGSQPALATIRTLYMDHLLDTLQQQLQQYRINSAVPLANGSTVQRDTLVALVNAWRRPPERGDERASDRGSVHAVFGLRDIHSLLTQLHQPVAEEHPAEQPAVAADLAKERFELQDKASTDDGSSHWGFTAQREEEADVWDMVYSGRAQETVQSWTSVEVNKSFRMLQGALIDKSCGGVGLSFTAADVGRIKDGDMIAFNDTSDVSDWHVGCVCWIRLKGAQLEVGVKRLQQRSVPATVRTEQQGRRSVPIECLLGPEQEQLRIVLPQMTGLENKQLMLESGAHEAHIVLLEQLEGSPTFRMFRFMEKQDAVKEVKAQRQVEAHKDEFDRFKSLWDVL